MNQTRLGSSWDKNVVSIFCGYRFCVFSDSFAGGSVIKFLTDGGDATEAFVEFHGRSKKAQLVLKGLKSRTAPAAVMKERGYNGKEALTRDYAKLRKELEDEGFFEPNLLHVVYRVVEVVAMHVLGAYLFMAPGASMAQQVRWAGK